MPLHCHYRPSRHSAHLPRHGSSCQPSRSGSQSTCLSAHPQDLSLLHINDTNNKVLKKRLSFYVLNLLCSLNVTNSVQHGLQQGYFLCDVLKDKCSRDFLQLWCILESCTAGGSCSWPSINVVFASRLTSQISIAVMIKWFHEFCGERMIEIVPTMIPFFAFSTKCLYRKLMCPYCVWVQVRKQEK